MSNRAYRFPSTNRTSVPMMRFTVAVNEWSRVRTYPNARATSKHECVSRMEPSAVWSVCRVQGQGRVECVEWVGGWALGAVGRA